MATPDGISTQDWDMVHELAVDIVNTDGDEHEKLKVRLLNLLEQLEEKYGELPSILATWADYTDDLGRKEQLLTRAYVLAEARHDSLNELELAHSLAELYIENFKDAKEGSNWLACIRRHSDQRQDFSRKKDYERLREELRLLQVNPIK